MQPPAIGHAKARAVEAVEIFAIDSLSHKNAIFFARSRRRCSGASHIHTSCGGGGILLVSKPDTSGLFIHRNQFPHCERASNKNRTS